MSRLLFSRVMNSVSKFKQSSQDSDTQHRSEFDAIALFQVEGIIRIRSKMMWIGMMEKYI